MRMVGRLQERHPKLFELVKFGIVGSIALIILYVVYYLLLSICNHNIAYTIGYMVSFVANYLMTVYFTFKVKSNARRSLGFAFSHVINYLMQIGCLDLFLYFGMSKQSAPFPVFALCVPINFLLVRYFVKNR